MTYRGFLELASRKLNQVRWAEIAPHRDYVKELLKTTTVTTTHQRLRDEGKLKVSLSTQGKRTDKNDYPPEKIAFQMKAPIWRAPRVGCCVHAAGGCTYWRYSSWRRSPGDPRAGGRPMSHRSGLTHDLSARRAGP